ncbi:MAG: hypothetical protein ACOC9P_01780, partial [bacterium]
MTRPFIRCLTVLVWVALVPPAAAQEPAPEKWSARVGGERLFDAQTELRRWQAGVDELPGVAADRLTTMRPKRRDRHPPEITGEGDPVHVWRGKPGTEAQLEFGELDIGVYVVRVIAMARTEDLQQHRKPLYVELTVNDKPGGGQSRYRHRVPYWDELFAVTELYFNADEKRRYTGALRVGDASEVDLFIHRVEFHDALAGLPRRAAKQRPGFFTYAQRDQLRRNVDPETVWKQVDKHMKLDWPLRLDAEPLSAEQRRKRDERLWHAFPPLNSQFVANYDESGFFLDQMHPGEMTRSEARQKYAQLE